MRGGKPLKSSQDAVKFCRQDYFCLASVSQMLWTGKCAEWSKGWEGILRLATGCFILDVGLHILKWFCITCIFQVDRQILFACAMRLSDHVSHNLLLPQACFKNFHACMRICINQHYIFKIKIPHSYIKKPTLLLLTCLNLEILSFLYSISGCRRDSRF